MLPGVSKTAVLTLRARVDEHAREGGLFRDPTAVEWFDRLPWPAELDAWYADGASTNVAVRVDDLDHLVRRYVQATGVASVVELGCGFSTRSVRLEDLPVRWTGLDLEAVCALRVAWDAPGTQLGGSVLDFEWMNALDGGPHLFVAEGLLYYLPREAVAGLMEALGRRFPGSVVLADLIGADDFPKLHAATARLDAAILWHVDPPFDSALDQLGLDPVPDFDLERLLRDAMQRYLPRLDPARRVMSWYALETGLYPPRRSGNLLGRL